MPSRASEFLLRFTSAGELCSIGAEGEAFRITGFSIEDFSSARISFFDRIHSGDSDLVEKLRTPPAEAVSGCTCLRFRHSDGCIRCLAVDFKWKLTDSVSTLILHIQNAAAKAQSIQNEDARLGVMLENTKLGIFFMDRNHVFVAANPEFRDRVRPLLNGRDVIGRVTYDFHSEAEADSFYASEKHVLQTGEHLETIHEVESPAGIQWILARYSPVRLADGTVGSIFVSTENLTDSIRAEERLDDSDRSAEARSAATVGSYILDVRRGLFVTSANLESIFGADPTYPHTIVGWGNLIHPADRESVSLHFQSVLSVPGRIFSIEYRIIRPSDGGLRWVHGIGYIARNASLEPLLMRGTVEDITNRKETETALRETRDRLQLFIEHAPAALAMFDREMRYLAVSRRWMEIEKQTPDIIGKCHYDQFPDLPERFKEAYRRGLAGESVRSSDDLWVRSDGRLRWQRWEILPWREADGTVGGIMLSIEDITRAKKAEERLGLAASVFEHASEAIVVMNLQAKAVEVNQAFTRITGYSRDEVIGKSLSFMRSPYQPPSYYEELWNTLQKTGRWRGEGWSYAKDGRMFATDTTITSVSGLDGTPQYYVALISDITSVKEHEQQLAHMAHHDALTGLSNRAQLTERLRQAIEAAQNGNQVLAVVYVDLDDFKAVNDEIGRDASDELLIHLANQMKQVLRDGDTLGRLGGDEFIAILPGLLNPEAALPIIERILRAVTEPYAVGEKVIQVSATAGAAFYPQPKAIDADQLVRQADQSMYQAKLSAKGSFQIFDPVRDSTVRGRNEELNRIRQALKSGEFCLYYQPKVNMATGTLIGAEALIRWQHPERGLLPPAQFLPVIEEHDLAIEVGEWVINTALDQIEVWVAAGYRIPVSVNISARHLQQPDFMDRLRVLLRAHPRAHCTCLELELLETSALHDMRHVSRIIEECREMGISVAIDDFGTGYSSLSYLKRLPANVLKIDQSFVRDMLEDPDDLAIMQGVLSLASTFRRTPIAEGVESIEHGVLLLKLGCYFAQGFAIAPPMPAEDILPWQIHWSPDPRWTQIEPITPLDWPILIAEVDLVCWSRQLDSYIRGTHTEPPELDERTCRLSHWIDAEKHGPRANSSALGLIDRLHRERHHLGREAVRMHRSGDTVAARELVHACLLNSQEIKRHLAFLCTTVFSQPQFAGLPRPMPSKTVAKLQ